MIEGNLLLLSNFKAYQGKYQVLRVPDKPWYMWKYLILKLNNSGIILHII